jgi:hypothetical protein
MKIWSSDYEVGAAIHRRVVAEGGWMVHFNGKSFFERRAENGSLTRIFSQPLMDEMRRSIRALKIYSEHRRRSMDRIGNRHTPPGVGSSEPSTRGKPNTRRSAYAGVQR